MLNPNFTPAPTGSRDRTSLWVDDLAYEGYEVTTSHLKNVDGTIEDESIMTQGFGGPVSASG